MCVRVLVERDDSTGEEPVSSEFGLSDSRSGHKLIVQEQSNKQQQWIGQAVSG